MELAEKKPQRLQRKLMGAVVMDDYLPRLQNNITTGNISQARALLAQIHLKAMPEKQEVLQMIALAKDATAIDLLSFLTVKPHKAPDIYDRLIQLIIDRAHLNHRFAVVLLENADAHTITHAAPLFKHILSNETSKHLLNRIIQAAGKLKIKALVDDIAEFIFYDDSGLKTEAVRALALMGTSHAQNRLEQASKTQKCDQTILDALESLRAKGLAPSPPGEWITDTDDCRMEIEQLASKDVNKRFRAFIRLSEKKSNGLSVLSKHLKTKDHDLTINILRLMLRTAPENAANDILTLLSHKNLDDTVKFAAYSALEAFPKLESAVFLVPGLSESAMFVRLAAAKALEKNLSDFVCAEIKKRIESGTEKGALLAETILDARASHLIESLMISDTFAYMASNYLARTASIQVLDTFIQILERRELKSTAGKYRDLKKEKIAQNKDGFIVISSSEAILNTYSKLIYACGFNCMTFQRSQDAVEAVASQKPCAIVCDLFLNDRIGTDVSKEVRKFYSKKEVPIILSTLQKSLDTSLLQRELDSAGVTAICNFPATSGQIKSWIASGHPA